MHSGLEVKGLSLDDLLPATFSPCDEKHQIDRVVSQQTQNFV